MLSWFLHLRIYLWNNTLTIVWIVNRDHNVSARTFRHLSAQSAVEYSMLTYLITSVASYHICWHFHLVIFLLFFLDIHMLSNFCVWNNSSLEFTHRLKSISMANFSAEEVSALQGGGNEVYFDIHLQLMYWLFFFFLFVSPFMCILVADH